MCMVVVNTKTIDLKLGYLEILAEEPDLYVCDLYCTG